MSPIRSYQNSKSWLELHPIVPTMLLIPVILALVILPLIFSGALSHETSQRKAEQTAQTQVRIHVLVPLCKVVDRYALATPPAISQETITAWYSFGHTTGCPNERANP